jgi:tetratricopeptide (TPR) repeat protein
MSGRIAESRAWCDALLARRAEGDDSVAWAKVLHSSALARWGQGDLTQAASDEEAAVAILRAADEARWLAYALALLGRVRTGQQRLSEARKILEEARAVWRGVETSYGQPFDAYLLYYLGSAALLQGDSAAARRKLEASLNGLDAARDDMARAIVLGALGLDAAQRGDHAEARARFSEGLPLLRRGGDRWDLALLLLNAGLEEVRAATPGAGPLLVEALRIWRELGRPAGIALALAGLGQVAAGAGAARRAGQLLGAGERLLPPADPLLPTIVPFDIQASLARARAADPAAFDRGVIEERAWPLDQAVAAGLADDAAA